MVKDVVRLIFLSAIFLSSLAVVPPAAAQIESTGETFRLRVFLADASGWSAPRSRVWLVCAKAAFPLHPDITDTQGVKNF